MQIPTHHTSNDEEEGKHLRLRVALTSNRRKIDFARLSLATLIFFVYSMLAQAQRMPVSSVQITSALVKYHETDKCSAVEARGITRGAPKQEIDYALACCFALEGEKGIAFKYLRNAIVAGFHDVDQLNRDSDLRILRDDSRWTLTLQDAQNAQHEYLKSVNADLYALFQQDQADRLDRNLDARTRVDNDRNRRSAAKAMLKSKGLKVADDYYHAAMLFQHGETPEDYKLARDLAEKALSLKPSAIHARWLSAAAQDRYLWSLGKPQWYGTQFHQDSDGHWTLEPFDTNAVTDAQRAEKNVPSLAETREILEKMNDYRFVSPVKEGALPP